MMEKIAIGKIVNTWGLKGDLKLVSYTDFKEERYLSGPVFIKQKNQMVALEIERYQVRKGYDIIKFKGYDEINLAKHLIGFELYSRNDKINILEEDTYHINDLLGLDVMQNKVKVGKIKEIRAFPQGDYLVVLTSNLQERLIPFRDEFVETINLELGYIVIVEMEGIL